MPPKAIPLDPDTILNCLPKLVTTAEPVDVTLSSVKWISLRPAGSPILL